MFSIEHFSTVLFLQKHKNKTDTTIAITSNIIPKIKQHMLIKTPINGCATK